jgi:hypothetical protein
LFLEFQLLEDSTQDPPLAFVLLQLREMLTLELQSLVSYYQCLSKVIRVLQEGSELVIERFARRAEGQGICYRIQVSPDSQTNFASLKATLRYASLFRRDKQSSS